MSDTEQLRSIPWLMVRLGVNERYVRRIVAEGRIPYVKVGHLIRFRESDVDAYIAAFVAVRLHGKPLRACMEAATREAATVCSGIGAWPQRSVLHGTTVP